MRTAPVINALWQRGGPFIGADGKPHTRVTVQSPWSDLAGTQKALDFLRVTETDVGIGNWRSRGIPLRYFQRADNGQVEIEVPNVKTVQIDRSIDQDAGTCSIVMYNQQMDAAGVGTAGQTETGNPGYFTAGRAVSLDAQARWGFTANVWQNVFAPNALLRTYQGYGGHTKSVEDCLTDGNLILSGVWLVDEVTVRSDGMLEMKCRDMAKLLIEQTLYPPLVPVLKYPLKYYRYVYDNVAIKASTYTRVTTRTTVVPGDKNAAYETSSVDAWYGFDALLHGHHSSDSMDGNTDTYFLGEGNSRSDAAFAVNYIQATCGEQMNAVYVHPWAGNYTMYVSVMENGVWQGNDVVPYDPAELAASQAYVNTGADIAYVAVFGVPWETPQEYVLPRTYMADRVRITFRDLTYTDYGPWHYRAGVREFRIRGTAGSTANTSTTTTSETLQPVFYAATSILDLTDQNVTGYITADQQGQIDAFGDARGYPQTGGNSASSGNTVSLAFTHTHLGYYELKDDGRVMCYGDAVFRGSPFSSSAPIDTLPNGRMNISADIMVTHTGLGYWVTRWDGTIHSYGDAPYYAQVTGLGMGVLGRACAHPSAYGLFLISSAGTVSVRGAATNYGSWNGPPALAAGFGSSESAGDIQCNSTGTGYWILTTAGRVEAHGAATDYGEVLTPTVSTDVRECYWEILPAPDDAGYILLRGDGYMFDKGTVGFFGYPQPGGAARLRRDGNYLDWTDIIKDLALWAGFLLYDPDLPANQPPDVYGNLESTGSFSPEALPDDMFDKKPVIDAMHAIKEAVAYLLWVDDEGALHFESPNWWSMGNWNEDGDRLQTLLEIDERVNMTNYQMNTADDVLASMIIISSENPDDSLADTVTTRVTPRTAQQLRGMIKPAMWVNGYFLIRAEQELMAELIALHIHFQGRIGQVSCAANPAIQINDQVRILERQTSETYIHYVRGISTSHDLDTGIYTMNLNTHWLGSDNTWAIQTTVDPVSSAEIDPNYPYMFWLSNNLKAKLAADPRRFGLLSPVTVPTYTAVGSQGGTGAGPA